MSWSNVQMFICWCFLTSCMAYFRAYHKLKCGNQPRSLYNKGSSSSLIMFATWLNGTLSLLVSYNEIWTKKAFSWSVAWWLISCQCQNGFPSCVGMTFRIPPYIHTYIHTYTHAHTYTHIGECITTCVYNTYMYMCVCFSLQHGIWLLEGD